MLRFSGCGTALVTPFKDGEVDYEAYAALVRRQLESGVDFLVAIATTAEAPALFSEEKVKLLKLTRELAGKTPVVVGCGSNSVPGTLFNMELLGSHGVDAWLVVVPFYNKPNQEGMYQYFKTVAAATTKPVIIYNVPGRTGANMSVDVVLRLAKDCPNIIAIKECSTEDERVKAIVDGTPEGFSVLSGDDDRTLAMMRLGGKGVISVASNIAPRELSDMTHLALEGKWDEAAAIDADLAELYRNCFVESNPVPVKAGLEIMGLTSSEVRLPLWRACDKTVELMKETIEKL